MSRRRRPSEHQNDSLTLNNGWREYLFGFLYQEEPLSEEDALYHSILDESTTVWNKLNIQLFICILLLSLADAMPVALTIAMHPRDMENQTMFAARCTASAAIGTAVGKLLLGIFVDIAGARRTFLASSLWTSACLLLLGLGASSVSQISTLIGLVEVGYSLVWPSIIVILATHYRKSSHGSYEGGVYVTSLGMRLGSLLGIPLASMSVVYRYHWRTATCLAAYSALLSSSFIYFYISDSNEHKYEPQNPVDSSIIQKWFPKAHLQGSLTIHHIIRLLPFIWKSNIYPSLKHVLSSGTFWILVVAHSGSSVLRTSERLLGSYFVDTNHVQDQDQRSRIAGCSAFFGLGMALGLFIAGAAFASRAERSRKHLVSRLFTASIVACYALAIMSLPIIHQYDTSGLLVIFQVIATAVAGFGISVPMLHVPALVGATYGRDKGLFCAYLDGIAYAVSSLFWRFLAVSIEHDSGWLYGWAAVALVLIFSGLVMVEFMEHYFCRHRYLGNYETILLA